MLDYLAAALRNLALDTIPTNHQQDHLGAGRRSSSTPNASQTPKSSQNPFHHLTRDSCQPGIQSLELDR